MAVYDATNHQTNIQSLLNTGKTLAETQKLLGETTQMRSTLGNVGASPFGAAGFTSGISAQLSGMQCLFPNLNLFNIPRSIMPNFSSVCSSRSFFNDMLTLEEVDGRRRPPEITRERVLSNREQMRKDAALNGLSLAYQQKQDVPQSARRIQSIAADAAAASDLVGKVDATNRLLAALAEQMIAQRMLLTGILEVTSAETLNGVPVNFATTTSSTAPYPTGGEYRLGQ
jgi:hypothetical protein